MRYLGGKARVAKRIVEQLNLLRQPGQPYYEPFLGGCSILPFMANPRFGSDIQPELAMLYDAIRDGWQPPRVVTEDEYRQLKAAPPSALKAFVGYGCSYGGKFFGGYAQDPTGRNYASNCTNWCAKVAPRLQGAQFTCVDYASVSYADNSLIYCDPPYFSTTGYSTKFDHARFWQWCRDMAAAGHTLLVSEYTAPSDVPVLLEFQRSIEMRSSVKTAALIRTERLYLLKGSTP